MWHPLASQGVVRILLPGNSGKPLPAQSLEVAAAVLCLLLFREWSFLFLQLVRILVLTALDLASSTRMLFLTPVSVFPCEQSIHCAWELGCTHPTGGTAFT